MTIPYNEIDPECHRLIAAINRFDGITTIESCSGHGHTPIRIWFVARDTEALPPLLYWFDA